MVSGPLALFLRWLYPVFTCIYTASNITYCSRSIRLGVVRGGHTHFSSCKGPLDDFVAYRLGSNSNSLSNSEGIPRVT